MKTKLHFNKVSKVVFLSMKLHGIQFISKAYLLLLGDTLWEVIIQYVASRNDICLHNLNACKQWVYKF